MGTGCSRDSPKAVLESKGPQQTSDQLSSADRLDDVSSTNQSGKLKYDTSIQPYVSTLETFELPPPPTTKQVGRSLLRKALMKAVATAVPKLVEKAAESLPFGSIAVALCSETVERVGLMKENRDMAEELSRHANKIVKHGQVILVYFDKTMDNDGKEEAGELLEHTFCAFRLVADATRKGVKGGILRLLKCKDLAEGIEQVKQQLVVAVGLTNLIFNSNMAKKELTERKTTDVVTNVPSVIANCRATDAKEFWTSNGFGSNEKVDLQVLLDALELWLEEKGVTIDSGESLADNDVLYFAFAGKRNLETVTAQRFVKVLGSLDSVLDGIKALLGQDLGSDESKSEVVATTEHDSSSIPASSSMIEKDINALLRETLRPVAFGEDLVRHQQVFVAGTREWVFTEFEAWASLPDGHDDRRVFWIKGTGGLGKSVIAAQLVKRYGTDESDVSQIEKNAYSDIIEDAASGSPNSGNKPVISAHFFCKHDHTDRNDPHKATATLAFRLASQHQGYAKVLCGLLNDSEKRKSLHAHAIGESRNVEDAFNELLAKPLTAALTAPSTADEAKHSAKDDIFILIDALDELRDGASRQQLLRLVSKLIPSLPANIRLIVTSRPEDDIVAFFKNLKPFVIDKQDELQQKDMELYVRREIVQQTGLISLDDETAKEEAVKMIMERADGVFLALKLITREISKRKDSHDSKDGMTLMELRDVLGSSGSLIDSTYKETLDRIGTRLNEAADGDKVILNMLITSLHDILAALVASMRPLRLGDLHRLCGSEAIKGRSSVRSKALTRRMMSALTLLYSASSRNSGVEPLHKTVTDYLTDPDLSGSHYVDVGLGHSILARTSLKVITESGFLEGNKFVEKEDILADHLLHYSLEFGHIHLSKCISVSSSHPGGGVDTSSEKGMINTERALEEWTEAFIAERSKVNKASFGQPKQYQPSEYQASEAFGVWMLLQTHAMGRRCELVRDFGRLSQALREMNESKDLMTDPVCQALASLMRDMELLYGAHWVSTLTNRKGLLAIKDHIPVTSCLFRSLGMEYLQKCLKVSLCELSLPLKVGIQPCLNTLKGHSDSVYSIALNPDGARIASASGDNTIKVWDAMTGEVISTLHGHSDAVISVAFSLDGTQVLSGSFDNTWKVWHAMTGEVIETRDILGDYVNSIAFSPDGKQVASGSIDKTIKVWDAMTGEVIKILEGHNDGIRSVAFSANGTRIVSGSGDHTVKIWDVIAGEVINTLEGHSSLVNSVAFNSDGTRVVSGSNDSTVKIWDTMTGEVISTFEGHSSSANSCVFNPDGTWIVSGSFDKTLTIWHTTTKEVINTFEGHSHHVNSVAFSHDGARIMSGSGDKTVKIWDAKSVRVVNSFEGHSFTVSSIAFNHDGSQIVSGSGDKTLKIWDISGEMICTLKGHNDWVTSVTFSPDGTRIVSGSMDNTVKIWDAMTGKMINTLEGHDESVTSVLFSPDGKRIVSGSMDNTVKIWDATTGEVISTLEERADSIVFSHDGTQIIMSCRHDMVVSIWDAATNEVMKTCIGNREYVSSVALSPDGTRIVSGSMDNIVRIWDAATGAVITILEGHSNDVASVMFSPDGSRIVSGSRDLTVRTWDAITGDALNIFEGHSRCVKSVTFSPDGTLIASGSEDNTVKIWSASVQETF